MIERLNPFENQDLEKYKKLSFTNSHIQIEN